MLNKVMLIGNIGRDAEIKQIENGSSVANFSIATNEKWKDREGQQQERVEWHKIVLWGKVVEAIGQYLVKGKQVYVEGSIQSRKWKDKDDNDRTTMEVKANQVRLLSSGSQVTNSLEAQERDPFGSEYQRKSIREEAEESESRQGKGLTVEDIPF